jgi:hypothetical protein
MTRKRTPAAPPESTKPAKPAAKRPAARKRAPRKRVTPLHAVPDAPVEPEPETLLQHVDAAVAQMSWLTPSDRALVEVARTYARNIDEAEDSAERAKRIGWIGPQLVNTMKALGGAPAERRALQADVQVKGKLAQMRSARASSE